MIYSLGAHTTDGAKTAAKVECDYTCQTATIHIHCSTGTPSVAVQGSVNPVFNADGTINAASSLWTTIYTVTASDIRSVPLCRAYRLSISSVAGTITGSLLTV